jgi:hypothetical protein
MTMPSMTGPSPDAVLQAATQAEPMQAQVGMASANIVVSGEQEKELIDKLSSAIDYHLQTFQPYLDKSEEWQKMFMVTPKAKDKPWPGSSNFPVPFLAEKIMSIHARLVRAIFNVDPIFLVSPRLPVPPEIGQRVETFFDYLIDRGNYRETMDMALLYSLIEGTAIVKVDYKKVTREIQSSMPEMSATMGTASPTDPTMETFTEFEGPRAQYVPLRDFVLFPLEKFDIDDTQGSGHRFHLTASQMLERENSGVYANAKQIVDAKQQGEKPSTTPTPILGEIGEIPTEVVEMYELWELFYKYDLDGTGVEVPLLVTFSKESRTLLRVIKFPYDHGKSPYVPIRPIPQPNLFYGLALSQFLEPIQKELTASFQRRADALARATLPPILRQRGSTWNPAEEPLQPGGVITVSHPDEITALQLPDYRPSNVQHEQMLIAFGERLTGISDYQVGRSAGSNRTFGEVRSVLAEGEVRIDVMLARIHTSMQRLAYLTFDIAYQFMPYGGMAAIGQQAFRVTPEMLRPPGIGFEAYEFIPNGSLSEASREQKLERTLVMTQQMMSNPLLMDPALNPQAPMVAAMLMKKVMIEAGWRDWEQYLPQIAQYQQAAAMGQPNPMEQQLAAQQQQAEQANQLAAQQAQVGMAKDASQAIANVAKAMPQQQAGGAM